MKNQSNQPESPIGHSDEPRVRPPEPTLGQKILLKFKPLIDQVERIWLELKKHAPFWARQVRQDLKRDSKQAVQAIRRAGQAPVYRLKGYTTVAKINRKRQSERQQRFLRRILLILFAFLAAILLINLYNPVKDLSEWYRIIGVKHLSDAINITTTTTSALP